MFKIFILLFSTCALADGRNVIGNLNKLTPDPAQGQVREETNQLRKEINELDKPKKVEKTPNQIQEERKQQSKSRP